MYSFYSNDELIKLGLGSVGNNVLISRKASFYNPRSICLGSNVRIDDFCILSGNINIEDYIHIAAYSALYGGNAGIVVKKYANISSRVCIYAQSDDYSGKSMTNPMISDSYKIIQEQQVIVDKNVIIGTGSTVLPGVHLSEGTAVGAMSLVKQSTEPWYIYAGVPVKQIKKRSMNLLNLETQFENNE